jgi:pyruvate formate lyase activating enzyme
MTETTAMIFNIQRFSVDDGPGIRTTVFFKGCPLRCIWCHNPESHRREPELMYNAQKCISCGACAAVCEHGGHSFDGERAHIVDRTDCISCGACLHSCPQNIDIPACLAHFSEMLASMPSWRQISKEREEALKKQKK